MTPPPILYKYVTPDRVDILKNLKIRFTPPEDFNDPFEFKPYFKHLYTSEDIERLDFKNLKETQQKVAEMRRSLRGRKAAEINKIINGFLGLAEQQTKQTMRAGEPHARKKFVERLDDLHKKLGVLCLCEDWNSLLMWGHYTTSHAGFVIGFDTTNAFFKRALGAEDMLRHLKRVSYEATRPAIVATSGEGVAWFYSKADVWSYENEWRMVLPLADAQTQINTTSGQIALFNIPHEAVKEVIFGAKCTHQTIDTVRILTAAWVTPPDLYCADIAGTTYDMVRVKQLTLPQPPASPSAAKNTASPVPPTPQPPPAITPPAATSPGPDSPPKSE